MLPVCIVQFDSKTIVLLCITSQYAESSLLTSIASLCMIKGMRVQSTSSKSNNSVVGTHVHDDSSLLLIGSFD